MANRPGLDDSLTRLHATSPDDEAAAERVMAAFDQPLPRQKSPHWLLWPGVLLDWQFAPAWPKVAALAGCAILGFAVGITGLDRRLERAAPFEMARAGDFAAVVFEPEPLTGLRP